MEVTAKLKYVRVGAQKARLVADLIRNKDVDEALRLLAFCDKKSATLIRKLLKSAIANANQKKVLDVDNLYVKTIFVDAGPVIRGFIPKAQGRAAEIRKKTSHINIVLGER